MIGDIIESIKLALSLWGSKESRKYLDELIEIEKRWMNEYKKGRPVMVDGKLQGFSSATLDEYAIELRHFRTRVSASAGITHIPVNL